jgi:hypothetical protein
MFRSDFLPKKDAGVPVKIFRGIGCKKMAMAFPG